MPRTHFTDAHVRRLRLRAGEGQKDYFQTLTGQQRSLVLTLHRSGRRTWSILFYEQGKPRRRKLGYFDHSDVKHPNLSCKEAMAVCGSFDVYSAMKRGDAGSFKDVAEKWFERHVTANKLRSASEIRRHLTKYVYPRWGTKPFASIRRQQVNELLDQIAEDNGTRQANAVLATIRSIMSWYEGRDDAYTSPIVRKMKRGTATKRQRWLSDDEIAELWEATGDMDTFGGIVRFALLTGQRRSKIASMQRWDVDGNGVWTMRHEAREKGVAGTFQLPPMAIMVLRDFAALWADGMMWPGRGGKAFNSWGQRKAELDAKLSFAKRAPWTLHDLRRTTRKLLTRAKVGTDIAELTLGHSIKGIQAVYDDPAEYRPAIEDALKRVSIEVQRILDPDAKVIKFPV